MAPVAVPSMAAPAWDLFVGLVVVLAVGVIGLARLSAGLLTADESLAEPRPLEVESGPALLANLAATHLGIAIVLGAVVWLTGIPAGVLGLGSVPDPLGAVLLGVGIYAVEEGFLAGATAFGRSPPERLREFLAPEDVLEWVLLLGVVLPVVAFGEELLFRGALIGGVGAATGVSPWVLVVVSSVAFGSAHTAQGSLGIVVTGVLGLVLGAAFVVTGDLLLVVVAHYIVNALQFVVHEGFGVEWGS